MEPFPTENARYDAFYAQARTLSGMGKLVETLDLTWPGDDAFYGLWQRWDQVECPSLKVLKLQQNAVPNISFDYL